MIGQDGVPFWPRITKFDFLRLTFRLDEFPRGLISLNGTRGNIFVDLSDC